MNLRIVVNPYVQRNVVVNVPNSSTPTNHNDAKAAFKWMHHPLEMMLVFGKAALALHDTFIVRTSMVFEGDVWCVV